MRISPSAARSVAVMLLAGPVGLLAGAPSSAYAMTTPQCTIETLGQPDWAEGASVTASDNTGDWLAGVAYGSGQSAIAIWHDDSYELSYAAGRLLNVTGVAHDGVVAGTYWSAELRPRGFVLSEGALTTLAVPARSHKVWVAGISRSGLISGWAESGPRDTQRPFFWTLDDPAHPVRMHIPAGKAFAVGTSPDGHTAVNMPSADVRHGRAFVVGPAGHRTELHGTAPDYGVQITAIGNGWAAGSEYQQSSHVTHQLRWDLGTGEAEITATTIAYVYAVNDQGTLGGEDRDSDLGELYTDHSIALPSLEDGYGASVRVVTSSGDAAGEAATSTVWAAVRWNCG